MKSARRGFTLLELMIAISLMLIVMLMLQSMFRNAQAMYLTAAKRVDVYSQARAALDIMEEDLLRMEEGDEDYYSLNLRSLTPNDLSRVDSIPNSEAYSKLDDWALPKDDQTVRIRELMSFTGRQTWYNRETERYNTGRATVVYYLRQRLPVEGEQSGGGYLVRRIIPQRTLAEIVRIQTDSDYEARFIEPTEDELASFVYGARVYVDDQAAFQLGTLENDWRYNTMPECSTDVPNERWLWVDGTPGAQPSTPNQKGIFITLTTPPREDRVEFGGEWRTMAHRDGFVSSRWNYPSVVMIDLTVIDRGFERYDSRSGSGTYRSFSRAVQLPISGPMFRLDDTDLDFLP